MPIQRVEHNFLASLETPGIQLSYVSFGQAIWAKGRLPETLSLILFEKETVLQMDAQPPLALDSFEVILAEPGQTLSVTLPQWASPYFVQLRGRNSEENRILKRGQQLCATEAARPFRLQLGDCVRHHLARLKFSQNQADFLDRVERLRDNLLELFCHFIGETPLSTVQRPAPDSRLIRIAHFIEQQFRWDYDPQILCKLAGMSLRNLYYGFEREFGTTPFRFYRNCKLARVRMALLKDIYQSQPIAWHATNEGFFHLSRFAAQYRGLFGELPSATVQRLQLRLTGIDPGACSDPRHPLSRCNPTDCRLWGHCQAPDRQAS